MESKSNAMARRITRPLITLRHSAARHLKTRLSPSSQRSLRLARYYVFQTAFGRSRRLPRVSVWSASKPRTPLIRDTVNWMRFGRSAPRVGSRIYIVPEAVRVIAMRPLGWELTGKVLADNWDCETRPLFGTAIPALRADDTARPRTWNDATPEEVHAVSARKIQAVHRRIREGVSWSEAGAYDCMGHLMEKYGELDGCRTLQDVEARYQRLDSLIAALRDGESFKTREELGGLREFGGIYIHVGRSGELIFGGGGCHRLAIAQALELRCVPAQVGVVHAEALQNGEFRKLLSPTNRRSVP